MAKGKRTFQPNNRRRARVHGFRARMRTRAGRAGQATSPPRLRSRFSLRIVAAQRHYACTGESSPPKLGFPPGGSYWSESALRRLVVYAAHQDSSGEPAC